MPDIDPKEQLLSSFKGLYIAMTTLFCFCALSGPQVILDWRCFIDDKIQNGVLPLY